jgi:hypothetical protein
MLAFNRLTLFGIAILFALSACGGGGGGDDNFVPTDPNTVFQLFPPGGPAVGTSSNTSLSGTDNFGDRWTATSSSQVQADTTFLGESVRPTLSIIGLTYVPTGAFINITSTSYIQYDVGAVYNIGSSSTTTTVSFLANPIPYTAKIGDLGVVGTYTNNVGDVTTQTWEVADAGSGRAKVILRTTIVDQFSTLIGSSVDTTVKLPDGTTVSTLAQISLFNPDVVINLSD